MAIIRPVRVGKGTKVHAGVLIGEVQKGRRTHPVYAHRCGSGNSSFMHNHHKAAVTPLPENTEIDCEKCKALLQPTNPTGKE